MLRAVTRNEESDRPTLVMGLSAENVRRLQAGKPISFDARELGIDCNIVIFAGETEDAMAAELETAFGPPRRANSDA